MTGVSHGQGTTETGDAYAGAARAVHSDQIPPTADSLRTAFPGSGSGACVFCGSREFPVSVEHVIPKWARRAFGIPGWLTLSTGVVGSDDRAEVARLQHLNIVLKDALCEPCNNAWLGGHEKKAARILKPMAVEAKQTVLDAEAQALIAFWAVKTGLLLELAWRQAYPGSRAIGGYEATALELAWLRSKGKPPPRSMVWLAYWDCQKEIPVRYEPSAAELPTADGSRLAGHLTTFTLGYVAFQIFTVDFLAAEQHGAPVWNTRPPPALRAALPRIWPLQATVANVMWPPPAFAHNDWRRMVTWDEELRP